MIDFKKPLAVFEPDGSHVKGVKKVYYIGTDKYNKTDYNELVALQYDDCTVPVYFSSQGFSKNTNYQLANKEVYGYVNLYYDLMRDVYLTKDEPIWENEKQAQNVVTDDKSNITFVRTMRVNLG